MLAPTPSSPFRMVSDANRMETAAFQRTYPGTAPGTLNPPKPAQAFSLHELRSHRQLCHDTPAMHGKYRYGQQSDTSARAAPFEPEAWSPPGSSSNDG